MRDWRLILFALCAFAADLGGAFAQEHIGSTAVARNDVTRDLAGAMGPLTVGDLVYRNEVVRTGADSTAKLIFLDSTNLGVGPVSRVTLDQFVYVGQSNGQKMAVNLAKGVFRFTTGKLDKSAYIISTPSAAIGVRGTVLDISVRSAQSRVTLVEGQALVCPRRPGITFEQQARNCARAAGGRGGPRCECIDLDQRRSNRAGQKGRRREPGEPDLDASQFRLALRRRFVALLRQQLRVRGPERRLRIGRTLRTIRTAQEPLAAS